jgi:hypothetical protein
MDDSVQITCTRCRSTFRDRARRVQSGYSRQCPNCEVIIWGILRHPTHRVALCERVILRRAITLSVQKGPAADRSWREAAITRRLLFDCSPILCDLRCRISIYADSGFTQQRVFAEAWCQARRNQYTFRNAQTESVNQKLMSQLRAARNERASGSKIVFFTVTYCGRRA